MKLKNLLLLSLAGVFAAVASAGPINWTVAASFDDGTNVSGSFTFDADTTTFSGLSLTTTGGSSVPAESNWVFNTNDPSAEQNAGGVTGFVAVDALSADESAAHLISLFSTSGSLMTDAGGTITLDFFVSGKCGATDCDSYNNSVNFSNTGSGTFTSASAVPEPSSLLLVGPFLFLASAVRRRVARQR